MMKTRLCTLLFFIAVASSTIFAQSAWNDNYERASLGLRIGFDLQTITGTDQNGDDVDYTLTPALNAGLTLDLPIATDFYLQPAVLFTTKGAEDETDILGETVETTIRTYYVEVPLHLLYKPVVGDGRLLLGFGPYAAWGVGGEAKYENGESETRDVVFQNEVEAGDDPNDVYFRPLDAGASFLAGYEFPGGLSFQVNAQLGLTEINPDYEGLSDDDSSLMNIGFGISLGYHF